MNTTHSKCHNSRVWFSPLLNFCINRKSIIDRYMMMMAHQMSNISRKQTQKQRTSPRCRLPKPLPPSVDLGRSQLSRCNTHTLHDNRSTHFLPKLLGLKLRDIGNIVGQGMYQKAANQYRFDYMIWRWVIWWTSFHWFLFQIQIRFYELWWQN